MRLKGWSRLIVKAVIWRLIAMSITASVLYLMTGRVVFSITTSVVIEVAKTIAYILYDRAWIGD